MKRQKFSKRLLIVSLIFSMLAIVLISCATPSTPVSISPPSFDIVRPDRPQLEDVEITHPVPDSLLRNLNVLVAYALQLEDYIYGIDQYIEELINIIELN